MVTPGRDAKMKVKSTDIGKENYGFTVLSICSSSSSTCDNHCIETYMSISFSWYCMFNHKSSE